MATRRKPGAVVKTSLVLPEALWRRVRIYAAEQRTDLRGVIIEALEVFLPKPKGGPNAK